MLKVKEAMNRRGMSQAELARRSGLSRQTIELMLKGGNPQLTTLRALAIALEIPIEELVEDPIGDGVAVLKYIGGAVKVGVKFQASGRTLTVEQGDTITATLAELRSGGLTWGHPKREWKILSLPAGLTEDDLMSSPRMNFDGWTEEERRKWDG